MNERTGEFWNRPSDLGKRTKGTVQLGQFIKGKKKHGTTRVNKQYLDRLISVSPSNRRRRGTPLQSNAGQELYLSLDLLTPFSDFFCFVLLVL